MSEIDPYTSPVSPDSPPQSETHRPLDTAAVAGGSASDQSADLSELQAQLAESQAKNAELAEQYLRAQAELQNTRRRADEDISKARKFAVESFAESLLPVMDSLEAGLAIKEASPEQIREGANATLNQLSSALTRHKVIAINPPASAKFDPHQHQAISTMPSEQEAGTVITVLQKGYTIAERVLRPALVTVSAAK